MRLTELHRTSSFRLATSFLGLFGAATLVLFTYLYVAITGFEMERIDDWLVREHAELQREQSTDLIARFDQQNLYDTRHQRPFGLFDAQGGVSRAVIRTHGRRFPCSTSRFRRASTDSSIIRPRDASPCGCRMRALRCNARTYEISITSTKSCCARC
ncbi:hypothetical protein [Caballeronia calidae]|uniref:hypothetical protein n=1 Tax=Caballeronia calidae TaxID=1777139 RepID=UPI0007892B42|nr:hypothetical protein [Caballeronia calidae]